MRVQPILPDLLTADTRYVHDEIANLVGRSQQPVAMFNEQGALIGPFPAMLQFPQFGIPALSFVRSLDSFATLDKRVREIIILTVGARFNARFELYAHEIMATAFGIQDEVIATLAAAVQPVGLIATESIAYVITRALLDGGPLAESTYTHGIKLLGREALAELFFLVGAYSLLAMVLNGFDVPAPVK